METKTLHDARFHLLPQSTREGAPFSLEFEFYRNLFSVRAEPFLGRPNEIPMADVCVPNGFIALFPARNSRAPV